MRESRGQLTAVSKAGGDPAYLEGMPVAMPFHCHLAEEGDCGLGQAPVCEIAGQRTGGGVEQRPAGRRKAVGRAVQLCLGRCQCPLNW